MVQWDKKRHAEDPEYRKRYLELWRRYRLRIRERGPDYLRQRREAEENKRRERVYGVSADQYQAMLKAQNGVCAICETKSKRNLSVDHCHETGKVRALLCVKCNAGLGCYGDNPAFARKAAAYLEYWKRIHQEKNQMDTKT
jgi:hypothetical protein